MALPRLAALLAFTLLLPLSGAAGGGPAASVTDAPGDERVILGASGADAPEGFCAAPAADVLSAHVALVGEDVVFRLALRDAAAHLACADGALDFGRGAASSLVQLTATAPGNVRGATLQVFTGSTDEVRVCLNVRGAAGSFTSCQTRARGDVFDGSEWTAAVPASGSGQAAGGATVEYDLRGMTYRMLGQASAVYDSGAPFGRANPSATHLVAADSTAQVLATL